MANLLGTYIKRFLVEKYYLNRLSKVVLIRVG